MGKKDERYIISNAFPATKWQDGTPVGNGRIGAIVYGCIYDERVLINHETLYDGGDDAPLPDVSDELPKLRQLLDDGKFAVAEKYYAKKLKSLGYKSGTGVFLPAFDVRILTETDLPFSGYCRALNMKDGLASITWKDGKTDYKREVFVDYDTGAVVIKTSASQNVIRLSARLEEHDLKDAVDRNGVPLKRKELPVTKFYVEDGIIQGKLISVGGKVYNAKLKVYSDGNTRLIKEKKRIKKGGMQGTSCFKDNFYEVSNAGTVIIVCNVNEEGENFTCDTPDDFDYEKTKNNHIEKFSKDFCSCEIKLCDKPNVDFVESQKIKTYNGKIGAAIIEKQALFGRYLLISSSTNCKHPANLQGVWNGAYRPAWSCTFFNNENLQMCYWQALSGNLPNTMLPLFETYLSFMDDYRDNAKKLFGCRGILLPLYMDNKSGKKKDIQPHVLYWTASSAWIADMFYDYYLCTSDRLFLKEKAYPFMKEAAQFYEDFMSTDENGYLKSYPSDSPENCASGDFAGANKTNVCINATMDFALLKQLLNNLIDAEQVLNVSDEKDGLWKEMLAKIPPYIINKDGAIAEWMDVRFRDNYAHRHLSHLYPVFPGREITEDNKQLFKSCKKALVLRNKLGLKEQTGWSLAHLANVYAVTGESKRAEQCLKLILRFCTGNNLFTYHNDTLNQGVTLNFLWANNAPFQIDANMGFTAAVQNMLLYSTENVLKIFPATPKQWKEISYGYSLARCGVKVKLTRKDKVVKLYLIATRDTRFTLKSGCLIKRFIEEELFMKEGEKVNREYILY